MIRTVPRRRGDPITVFQLDRAEFLDRYWSYRAGDHVTILAPTDCGKTYLNFQLLERAQAHTGIAPIFFATKPRDDLVRRRCRELGYRLVRDWPPPVTKQITTPAGWLLWPKHTLVDTSADDEHHARVFRDAMMQNFKAGAAEKNPRSSILVWDEAATLADYLGLKREEQTILKRGRSCKCGAWSQDQRAVNLPYEAYNCAEHLFLHRDPDKRNSDRYDEIGGFDPGVVSDILQGLPKWHYLYLRRSDMSMCVIGP